MDDDETEPLSLCVNGHRYDGQGEEEGGHCCVVAVPRPRTSSTQPPRYALQDPRFEEGLLYTEQTTHFKDCHDVLQVVLSYVPKTKQIPLRLVGSRWRNAVDDSGVPMELARSLAAGIEDHNKAVTKHFGKWYEVRRRYFQFSLLYCLLLMVAPLLVLFGGDEKSILELTYVSFTAVGLSAIVPLLALGRFLLKSNRRQKLSSGFLLEIIVFVAIMAALASGLCTKYSEYTYASVLNGEEDNIPIAECASTWGSQYPKKVRFVNPGGWALGTTNSTPVGGEPVYIYAYVGVRLRCQGEIPRMCLGIAAASADLSQVLTAHSGTVTSNLGPGSSGIPIAGATAGGYPSSSLPHPSVSSRGGRNGHGLGEEDILSRLSRKDRAEVNRRPSDAIVAAFSSPSSQRWWSRFSTNLASDVTTDILTAPFSSNHTHAASYGNDTASSVGSVVGSSSGGSDAMPDITTGGVVLLTMNCILWFGTLPLSFNMKLWWETLWWCEYKMPWVSTTIAPISKQHILNAMYGMWGGSAVVMMLMLGVGGANLFRAWVDLERRKLKLPPFLFQANEEIEIDKDGELFTMPHKEGSEDHIPQTHYRRKSNSIISSDHFRQQLNRSTAKVLRGRGDQLVHSQQ